MVTKLSVSLFLLGMLLGQVSHAADAGCTPGAEENKAYHLLCFIVDETGHANMVGSPVGGLVIAPNKSVKVQVWHKKEKTVTVTLDGTPGLSTGGTSSGPKIGMHGMDLSSFSSSVFVFAPRRAGNLNLQLVASWTEAGETKSKPTTIELIVDERYAGAVRLGFSTVLKPLDSSLGIQQRGDDRVLTEYQNEVDLEIVVGYAFFPEAFRGGRSYLGAHDYKDQAKVNCDWRLPVLQSCLAPYVAFGFLSAKGREQTVVFEALKSVYFGMEVEFHPNMSLAFAGVVRRVSRFQENYAAGAVVPSTLEEPPSRDVIHPGFAIMLNISPNIFKVVSDAATQQKLR